MENQETQVKEILGNPTTIRICGKDVEVKKLKMKGQVAVLDKVVALAGSDNSSPAKSFELMSEVLSVATGISVEQIENESDMDEVIVAFKIVWKQNGFDFLSQKAANLKQGLVAGEDQDSQK